MSIWKKKKKITECDIALEYLKRKKIKQEKLSIQKNWSCAESGLSVIFFKQTKQNKKRPQHPSYLGPRWSLLGRAIIKINTIDFTCREMKSLAGKGYEDCISPSQTTLYSSLLTSNFLNWKFLLVYKRLSWCLQCSFQKCINLIWRWWFFFHKIKNQ